MIRRFTGRHMLSIMLGFFAVIVAVNVTMATLAARTFGGKVVDNSYVAGQRFNGWLAAARAQERLGWTTSLALDAERRVTLVAATAAGPLAGAEVSAIARHPVGRAADLALSFRADRAGRYVSTAALPRGRWLVHVEVARGGAVKRQIESLS